MPLVDSLAPRRRSGEREGRGSGGLPRWCCPNAPFDGEFPTFVLRWAAMICYKNTYLWQQSGGFKKATKFSTLKWLTENYSARSEERRVGKECKSRW